MTELSNFSPNKPPFPFGETLFHGYHGSKGRFKDLFRRIGIPFLIVTILTGVPALIAGALNPEMAANNFSLVTIIVLLISYFASFFVWASFQNSLLRWFLHHDLSGQLGALRFGRDEFRTMGVGFVYLLLVFILPFLVIFMFTALSTTMAGFGAIFAILLIPLMLGIYPLIFFMATKLCLCIPLSLDQKRFMMFDSFRLTKGRGWALFGTYFLLGLMAFGIIMVFYLIGILALMGPMMSEAFSEGAVMDPNAINQSFYSGGGMIGMVVFMLVMGVLQFFMGLAYSGTVAFAMRFLQEEKGEFVANIDVFD